MSVFVTAHAVCPTCSAAARLDYPASINADRRPDLRAAIMDRSLHTVPCRHCGETLTFEPHITYLDQARGQWILAEHSGLAANWRAAEAEAGKVYDLAFGAVAPAAARTIGARLKPRLVFGWPALIEKLLCFDFGLDDIALESLKLAILKDGPERIVDPSLDLRLTGRDETNLVFTWLDPRDGDEHARLAVPEVAYIAIRGDAEGWAGLAAILGGRMYADMNRVLRDSSPAAAA